MYTETQIKEENLKYFKGDELAASAVKKYLLKNNDNKFVESTPKDIHNRLIKEFTRIEKRYKNNIPEHRIRELLDDFKYVIPQGSVMSMAGNNYQVGSLSNCVVIPKIYDSYGGINFADAQLAALMKRRCGVGLDISTIRPLGKPVANAAGTSTGAVSFMERYSNTTREVAQDGRRGALMITINVAHPDIEQFITIKQDLTKVTGANISVLITDEFLKAVHYKEEFPLRFPIDSNNVIATIDANYLWDKIVECAYNTAEPGLMFWDTHVKYSPTYLYDEFEPITSNPCSEIVMGNDTCRLICANMFSHVINPFKSDALFDYESWYNTCYDQQKLADDIVDLEIEAMNRILEKIENDPEPDYIKEVEKRTWEQLKRSAIRGRRTGCGFTALGDTLAALGLQYGKESYRIIDSIMQTKLTAELDAMCDMAEIRGEFPAFDPNVEKRAADDPESFNYFLKTNFPERWERMLKVGRRNVSWSTVAPTGTVSIMTQTTSGIEPLFKAFYTRRKKINPNDNYTPDFIDANGDKWKEFSVLHKRFEQWISTLSDLDNPASNFSIEELKELFIKSPYYKNEAGDIKSEDRINIQGIIQKYTTHSISSTVNLNKDSSIEDVKKVYMMAHSAGLKGITVYVDGSRDGVLITEDSKKEQFNYIDAPKRPKELKASLHEITVKGEKWKVAVGLFDNKPYEVFAFKSDEKFKEDNYKILKRSKGIYSIINSVGEIVIDNIVQELSDEEALLTRMTSTALRHGTPINFVVEQLNKSGENVVSFSKAIARTLKKYIDIELEKSRQRCTNCGSDNLKYEEGCYSCLDCGFSGCT